VHRRSRARKVLARGLLSALVIVAAVNAYTILAARERTASDPHDLPHAQTAIVLGALVHQDGRMSAMLADRVRRATALWRSGKVDRVLVSGDHQRWSYDEPNTMRKALMRAGVPSRAIFTDHAGFNTWASMVRARKVFGVRSAIVVTQGFHMPRALHLAAAAGIPAHGLVADLRGYGREGTRSRLREMVARVKGAGEAALHSSVLLGPRVPIVGDGRASWGPAPPPGTPPAGAPGR
jgi:SanA protein